MKTTSNIEASLTAILPPDDAPLRCPRCGRIPELHETAHLSWFECRKWFGLQICTKGPEVFEGRQEGQWSRRSAAYAWNRVIMRHTNRRRR